MFTLRRDAVLAAAIVAAGCLTITSCTSPNADSSRAAASTPSASTPSVSTPSVSTPSASTPSARVALTSPAGYSADEAAARTLVHGKVDRFGWVRSTVQTLLSTYFPRGQRYLGGERLAPTDQILVVKMHGAFDHSGPPGSKTSASLALGFYDVTTRRSVPFSQMWDDDAPDLGVGYDGGITNRELAAQRWDLRLVGIPTVRSG